MKTKGSKHRKHSSTSSDSDSESSKSRGSTPPVKSKDKKHSKGTKPSKRDQFSDDSDHKDKDMKLKNEETDTSKWDSPVNLEISKSSRHDKHGEDQRPKGRNSDEQTSKKSERHEEREKDERHNRRKDSRQRDRDRSYEDRNHDGRHDRKNNSRGGGSHSDKRQQSSGRRSRERSPFRDNHRNYSKDKHRDSRRRRSASPDNANYAWGKGGDSQGGDLKQNFVKAEKEKPNFQLSGKLTEETNMYRGVMIKYSEPPDARKPKRRWRLYPFKGEKAMQTLYIHRQSAYLMGRDRKIADLAIDHPSCSKQHAVLQYRLVPFLRDDGSSGKRVRPYIIDLESANGTFINNNRIDAKKYVELLEKDVIKFGYSSREYVLLHENSKDEAQDDDVKQEDDEVVNVKEEPKDE